MGSRCLSYFLPKRQQPHCRQHGHHCRAADTANHAYIVPLLDPDASIADANAEPSITVPVYPAPVIHAVITVGRSQRLIVPFPIKVAMQAVFHNFAGPAGDQLPLLDRVAAMTNPK